ncbi:putative glycosyl transferase [Acidianus bottle-shaped virus]|uniref:Putative glycosyltransferase ORF315 n=1 Tax=Acidianus bottle-shaped virus (isolate Italy/Pozzuoli) TaxID=654911 RepID=GT315_ABVP|nr:glycosyltransferase [Acidianus bottle-shaped virus]A4ZUA5.1 RecName: Full=Putative glycosyltransferase ORF315 [Acidianus bottle-shaped virus (isolate Pozzuoli)]ABP73409.1 putative glycosyl transferase [Acidianus bottle-shaped virus]
MTMITFLTTTQNGSYDRLATRQAVFLKQNLNVDSQIIRMAQTQLVPVKGSHVIIYTTFNIYPVLINKYRQQLEGKKCVALLDSALMTIPYRNPVFKDPICTVYTTSRFNQENFATLGVSIPYIPHFIPDPNPEGKLKSLSERQYDFITVGINEMDFDRKGHFWNFLVQRWGFKAISVCKFYCFGDHKQDLPDEELWSLYANTKWYLGTSHAETPHLPLLEAYAFGTPAVYISAHEFRYIGFGIPISPAYINVKGTKNFYFAEINTESFIQAVGKAMRMSEGDYNSLSKQARRFFENNYSLNNRVDEFRALFDDSM